MNLTILGSTGSIGTSTLDVVSRHPEKYRVTALTAQCRDDVLFEQCLRFQPRYAVLLDEAAAERLVQKIAAANLATEVLCGADALERVVSLPEVDAVMAAIVGAAGLRPTLAALQLAAVNSLEDVLKADAQARAAALEWVRRMTDTVLSA